MLDAMASSAPLAGRGRDISVGLLGPLALIAAANGLLVLGNAAIHVGPFDRATFGWLVPVPLWSVSPAAAAYLWRRLPTLTSAIEAVVIGTLLTVVATWFLYSSWASSDCQLGLNKSNAEFLGQIIPVGLVIGGGWAATAFLTRRLVLRGQPRLAAVLGTVGGFAIIFLAIGAAVLTNLFAGVCNRPT
jgi:hypothetical protein